MMADSDKEHDFYEIFRKRPGMFLGELNSKGICNLLTKVINSLISTATSLPAFFRITLDETDQITITSDNFFSKDTLIQGFHSIDFNSDLLELKLLSFATKELTLTVQDQNSCTSILFSSGKIQKVEELQSSESLSKCSLSFKLDAAIFKSKIDYCTLNDTFYKFSYLNRNVEVLIEDKRFKYLNQNYHYYPEGIKHIYDRVLSESWGGNYFEVFIDQKYKDYEYQIGIAMQNWWGTPPKIITYANQTTTVCGGSLFEGIVDGMIKACKTYAAKNLPKKYKFKKALLFNSLIIVAAIKGKDLNYGGNFKQTLEMPDVKSESKDLVYNTVLEYLNSNTNDAGKLISRFHINWPLQNILDDKEN